MGEILLGIFALFMLFVLPLWLLLHYLTRGKAAKKGFDPEKLARLEALERTAAELEERARALESILDEKSPDWRRQE
jgi:phage shock protein B